MSDYQRYKVVRYKPTEEQLAVIDLGFGDFNEYSDKLTYPFMRAPTTDDFIDYVLNDTYGDECGEYGKIRKLYDTELSKYIKLFSDIIPDPEPDNFRVVDYCYYNCCEAPSYFEESEDEFYQEI